MCFMSEVSQPTDITTLLRRWQAGDSHAYDLVIGWAYQRMLAIAAGFAAQEHVATEPAALVNEAYLRLRKLERIEWQDRNHFFSVVAAELRRILIDQARLRLAHKRGGQPAPRADVGGSELDRCPRPGHAGPGPGFGGTGAVGRRQGPAGRAAVPDGLHGSGNLRAARGVRRDHREAFAFRPHVAIR